MKRFLLILFIIFFCNFAYAEDNITLEAGISVDKVPKALYGSWRVFAVLEDTNSYATFKPKSMDFWTLSRIDDKITLSNPFTGANANISVQTIEGNLVVFSKIAPYNNKKLTDTITIRLNQNDFSGINTLLLESYSLIDNHVMKTERATYKITGEKISGDSIISK